MCTFMTTVEDIEGAVCQLAPAELDRFRWFDVRHFDKRIERDMLGLANWTEWQTKRPQSTAQAALAS
jgi:hypothetical protein